jgi:SsrA-binding protein
MASDISVNRKGLRDYHILERYEAGMELKGTEVKSIRAGLVNINGAFARIENGQVFLYGADIQPYEKASHEQHEPKRTRRLLLHRNEIDKLFGMVSIKGHALPLLRLYWKNGKVKAELGVGSGKAAADKREDMKRRTEQREIEREVARFHKGRR